MSIFSRLPAARLFVLPRYFAAALFAITFAIGAAAGMHRAAAQDATDQADIQAIISSQLQAFNDSDIATAWTFASPMIQGLFGTAENFGAMVQNGYPMVWRNRDVRYLDLREVRGQLYQKVMIRDGAGGLHILDYRMTQTPDGWRIDGVEFLPAPDVGA